METIVLFFGFGLGASLGVNLVRAVSRGLRPAALDVIRGALAAGDAVGTAAEQVRLSVVDAASEARQEGDRVRNRADAKRPPRRSQPKDQKLRKIEIARE